MIELKMVLSFVPVPLTTAMMASDTPAASAHTRWL
jgi:hypothetical protein